MANAKAIDGSKFGESTEFLGGFLKVRVKLKLNNDDIHDRKNDSVYNASQRLNKQQPNAHGRS